MKTLLENVFRFSIFIIAFNISLHNVYEMELLNLRYKLQSINTACSQ